MKTSPLRLIASVRWVHGRVDSRTMDCTKARKPILFWSTLKQWLKPLFLDRSASSWLHAAGSLRAMGLHRYETDRRASLSQGSGAVRRRRSARICKLTRCRAASGMGTQHDRADEGIRCRLRGGEFDALQRNPGSGSRAQRRQPDRQLPGDFVGRRYGGGDRLLAQSSLLEPGLRYRSGKAAGRLPGERASGARNLRDQQAGESRLHSCAGETRDAEGGSLSQERVDHGRVARHAGIFSKGLMNAMLQGSQAM